MDYKKAGVDIEAGKNAVTEISSLVKSTFSDKVIDNFGLFGSLYSLEGFSFKNPVLVSGTDGVGTKLKIAFDAGKHDTIGIDLVAMSINDIACLGAKPLFFLDYVSTSSLDPAIIKKIITGIVTGCKMSGCSLVGGEMAEMPSFYQKGEYDLAGFAVGIVERDEIINGKDIKKGDKVIGLASSGLHSNGYSLARKIIFDLMNLKISDTLTSDGKTVGNVLIEPTMIYSPLIQQIKENFKIKGIAHITGGGLPENIVRILPGGTVAKLDKSSWVMPEIFSILKKEGQVEDKEFYRVLNAGIGMVMVVENEAAQQLVSFINQFEYSYGNQKYLSSEIGYIDSFTDSEKNDVIIS